MMRRLFVRLFCCQEPTIGCVEPKDKRTGYFVGRLKTLFYLGVGTCLRWFNGSLERIGVVQNMLFDDRYPMMHPAIFIVPAATKKHNIPRSVDR